MRSAAFAVCIGRGLVGEPPKYRQGDHKERLGGNGQLEGIKRINEQKAANKEQIY